MKIRVIHPDGNTEDITATAGETLMDAIPSLFGDCGGNCVCGTCHVKIISEHDIPLDDFSKYTLDLEQDVEYNSRLSCQIMLTDEHDNLIVEVVDR